MKLVVISMVVVIISWEVLIGLVYVFGEDVGSREGVYFVELLGGIGYKEGEERVFCC